MYKEKVALTKLLKEQVISSLYSQKRESTILAKTAERPQEVLIKFKQLLDNKDRIQNTLILLERKKIEYQLNQAKYQRPWQLITTPTLLDYPVAPRKKVILIFGLFSGLIFGSGIALFINKFKK